MHPIWKGARVVEEARLESVYTPKGYQGFESPSFRGSVIINFKKIFEESGDFFEQKYILIVCISMEEGIFAKSEVFLRFLTILF